jgi:hypothetical protein
MRLRSVVFLLGGLLAGCEGGTGPGAQPGDQVIDRMILTDATQFYSPGDFYVFNDHWQAQDSHGRIIPLVDSAGIPIDRGLRYGFGDSLAGRSQPVDSGVVALQPFIGYLYVFAPTTRAPIELMGRHYMAVQ